MQELLKEEEDHLFVVLIYDGYRSKLVCSASADPKKWGRTISLLQRQMEMMTPKQVLPSLMFQVWVRISDEFVVVMA